MKFDHSAAHKQYSLAAIAKVLLNDNNSQQKGEKEKDFLYTSFTFHNSEIQVVT